MVNANAYSGHSLRRGFANWANANSWDIKSLMAYVGWRKVDTAMRYVDASTPFMPISTASHLSPPMVTPGLPLSTAAATPHGLPRES